MNCSKKFSDYTFNIAYIVIQCIYHNGCDLDKEYIMIMPECRLMYAVPGSVCYIPWYTYKQLYSTNCMHISKPLCTYVCNMPLCLDNQYYSNIHMHMTRPYAPLYGIYHAILLPNYTLPNVYIQQKLVHSCT